MQIDVLDPTRTAMIVVDMQNDFVAAGAPMETPAARAMVPRLAEALRLCRAAGTRVILHRSRASPRWLRHGRVRRHASADRQS